MDANIQKELDVHSVITVILVIIFMCIFVHVCLQSGGGGAFRVGFYGGSGGRRWPARRAVTLVGCCWVGHADWLGYWRSGFVKEQCTSRGVCATHAHEMLLKSCACISPEGLMLYHSSDVQWLVCLQSRA